MSIRKGNNIIASKPLVDAVPTQDSTNAVSSGGVYTALQSKQDTISDLATIRSGAAAGATAVQPATLASYVTLATAQTISGVKTFSSELHSTNNITFDSAQATPIIRGMSGANYRNMIVRTNSSSSIDVGNPNDTINLKGSATNPTYNGNNLALYSDLPTVNNPTITLTQGGVTKGSFTLNQASGDTIDFDAGGGIDAGFVMSFAGTTAPNGWLVCDGSAVSRTTYADLFAIIGTTYGVGDGSTTFNLPDISDCFVQGGTPGTTHSAGLPNVIGGIQAIPAQTTSLSTLYGSGAFLNTYTSSTKQCNSGGANQPIVNLDFDASLSNSIYGNSTTVQPKSVEMLYCIKY